MPRLWSATLETHRRAVVDAIIDVTAALVAERGLRAVTMAEIAVETGIGRATLYKYFPDVESILVVWHERRIEAHLARLADVRARADGPLEAVLEAYALTLRESRRHHDEELAALLHRDERLRYARHRLHALVRDLIAEGRADGTLRSDVSPDELAWYAVHALAAAGSLQSRAAVRRLVEVTLGALRAPQEISRRRRARRRTSRPEPS